jgi:hypothetical protein
MNSPRPMLRAFFYLQGVSLYNGVRVRLQRLRQPKYLMGALAGGAYMYFFAFRHLFEGGGRLPPGLAEASSGTIMSLLSGLFAAALLVLTVLAWLLPSGRAALAFNEAEVGFLFPAPLSRVSLIQFSLLRSQLGIFFSAFLMSLLLRRGGNLSGNAVQHAFAIWIVLATARLHLVGASFGRERLLDFGVRPWLRRTAIVLFLLVAGIACWWWIATHVPLPTRADLADQDTVTHYVGAILATPPLSWILLPFRWLVAPFFAPTHAALAVALVPALGLLLAHYLWVVRSDVRFEEASMDRARQRAERRQAKREGKSGARNGPKKPRSAPFVLAPTGFAPTAFLWKGLVAAGPFWRLRSFLVAAAVAVGGAAWLGADPARRPLLQIVGSLGGMLCLWLFLAGPMFLQRSLRGTLEYLDVLKGSPLRGWQIVLGELLTPAVMMAFGQWLALILLVMAFGVYSDRTGLTSGANVVGGAIGFACLSAPLCALMLCVPFAGMLVFPAWSVSSGGRDAGMEVMGQRLIFFGAYLMTMVVAMLPAGIVGGLGFVLVDLFAPMPAALVVAGLLGGMALAVELGGAVLWLGKRIDRFDLAQELR